MAEEGRGIVVTRQPRPRAMSSQGYEIVQNGDSIAFDRKHESSALDGKGRGRGQYFCQRHATSLNLIFFCVSLSALALSVSLRFSPSTSRNKCLKQTSTPSPLLSSIDLPIVNEYLNITLLLGDNPSIFRQEPSPEVDLAWGRIGDLRLIPLTREDVVAIGKNPDEVVKFPENFGLGESYVGRLDVFHQIHCLDALRREAFFEHYYAESYPGGWKDTTEMHRLHLSHCIEYLLSSIMCQASTDVYTHIWTDTFDHAWPDFRNNHQCRDYSAIKKWQDRNAVDVDEYLAMRAPEGATVHRMSREFKDVNGYFNQHQDDGNHGSEIL